MTPSQIEDIVAERTKRWSERMLRSSNVTKNIQEGKSPALIVDAYLDQILSFWSGIEMPEDPIYKAPIKEQTKHNLVDFMQEHLKPRHSTIVAERLQYWLPLIVYHPKVEAALANPVLTTAGIVECYFIHETNFWTGHTTSAPELLKPEIRKQVEQKVIALLVKELNQLRGNPQKPDAMSEAARLSATYSAQSQPKTLKEHFQDGMLTPCNQYRLSFDATVNYWHTRITECPAFRQDWENLGLDQALSGYFDSNPITATKMPHEQRKELRSLLTQTLKERLLTSKIMKSSSLSMENQMNPNARPVEVKTYIFGQDITTLSDDQLFDQIRRLEGENASLDAIKAKPKSLVAKIAENTAAIEAIVKVMDAR